MPNVTLLVTFLSLVTRVTKTTKVTSLILVGVAKVGSVEANPFATISTLFTRSSSRNLSSTPWTCLPRPPLPCKGAGVLVPHLDLLSRVTHRWALVYLAFWTPTDTTPPCKKPIKAALSLKTRDGTPLLSKRRWPLLPPPQLTPQVVPITLLVITLITKFNPTSSLLPKRSSRLRPVLMVARNIWAIFTNLPSQVSLNTLLLLHLLLLRLRTTFLSSSTLRTRQGSSKLWPRPRCLMLFRV